MIPSGVQKQARAAGSKQAYQALVCTARRDHVAYGYHREQYCGVRHGVRCAEVFVYALYVSSLPGRKPHI